MHTLNKGLRHTAAGLALAMIFVGASAPVQAVAVAGSCFNYDDDGGFGGSDVSCDLPCGNGAALLVGAWAADSDATVSGAYNCGGQGAGCPPPGAQAQACAGASPGLTNKADEDGQCKAESDEWWSSTVYVACATLGALPSDGEDVIDYYCSVFPDTPPCDGVSIGSIMAICLETIPGLAMLPPQDLVGLFPASFAGRSIFTMRSMAIHSDGSFETILFDGLDCDFTSVS